ncbi:HAD family hydrolase [Colwellia sp. KU-HH00111]|uniref:HAD family hydrolase n=1 Tax=Colwellia sp. KU-HH00111 TaxID=3127652 RepID=UPI0031053CF6
MINVYLFDWGDTLMVDFPDAKGKMCEWETVQAVAGAKEALAALSESAKIYIATGAADSTELEIKKAFVRVGLNQFISGYFCKANIGLSKGTPDFLNTILANLKIAPANVAMVGDNFDKDIKPAIAAGIQPIWVTKNNTVPLPDNVKVIKHLSELY